MKTHELKCHPHFFEALKDGSKPFEIRRNDRHYQKDDVLVIRKYDPAYGLVPGEEPLTRVVTYVMSDEDFPAIAPGFVIMGLRECSKPVFEISKDEFEAKVAINRTCNEYLKLQGEPYPRTCRVHGLNPCPKS